METLPKDGSPPDGSDSLYQVLTLTAKPTQRLSLKMDVLLMAHDICDYHLYFVPLLYLFYYIFFNAIWVYFLIFMQKLNQEHKLEKKDEKNLKNDEE